MKEKKYLQKKKKKKSKSKSVRIKKGSNSEPFFYAVIRNNPKTTTIK